MTTTKTKNGNGTAAATVAANDNERIMIKPIVAARVTFGIKQRGDSPMVQHAWSEKALEMLRMTAAERRKRDKVARNPEEEALACQYKTAVGVPGIPAMAFKSALVGAAHKDLGLEKTLVRKGLFIVCDDPDGVLPMEYGSFEIREDIVRVGIGQTDIRYRPEFRDWSCIVTAEIDMQLLTEQDVVNLVNRAGFGVGIGEWRPEKGGEWGRFEVDVTVPIKRTAF